MAGSSSWTCAARQAALPTRTSICKSSIMMTRLKRKTKKKAIGRLEILQTIHYHKSKRGKQETLVQLPKARRIKCPCSGIAFKMLKCDKQFSRWMRKNRRTKSTITSYLTFQQAIQEATKSLSQRTISEYKYTHAWAERYWLMTRRSGLYLIWRTITCFQGDTRPL